MPDRYKTFRVECRGGLVVSTDPVSLANERPGAAIKLINFEANTRGGYRRINGYAKFDNAVVPGTDKVLGVAVAQTGVYASRRNTGTGNFYSIYVSDGAGWGAVQTSRIYNAATTDKVRGLVYNMFGEKIVFTDGTNPAGYWDGTTFTTATGTGAPSNAKYAAEWRNRIALSGYSSNPAAISLSAPNDDDNFNPSSGAIEFSVGDRVLALKNHRDSLYIFCENSIKKLVGETSADFRVERVTDNIGLYGEDSVQEVNGDLVFLSYDGIRPVSQTERNLDVELGTLSLDIQPIVQEHVESYSINDFTSLVLRNKNQYRLFVTQTSNTRESNPGICGVLRNTPNGLTWEWSELQGILPSCADSRIYEEKELAVHGGYDGFVYRHDFGTSFDTNDIKWTYKTPYYDNGDTAIRKVLYKLEMFQRVEGATEAVLNVIYDYGNSDTKRPPSQTLSQAAGTLSVYGSATYGQSMYGGTLVPSVQKNLIGSGRSYSFEFSGADTKPSFTIQSFVVQFNDAGRR